MLTLQRLQTKTVSGIFRENNIHTTGKWLRDRYDGYKASWYDEDGFNASLAIK